MSWAGRTIRRTFKDWEVEIARPVVIAIATGSLVFLFSLLFRPVRRFLFDETVPYPIYCTAETYSTPSDLSSARTEVLLINTTNNSLSRSDLVKQLSGRDGDIGGPSPDLKLVYTRGIGHIVRAEADGPYNEEKGEVKVKPEGTNVVIQPQHFNPRAILRVVIDVAGLDPVAIKRAAHKSVLFEVEEYERACYTR